VFIGLLASVEGGEIVKAVLEDVTEKTGTGEEVVTESGLKYVDLKIGGGKSATKGDFVGIQLKLSDANDPSKVFVDTTAKGGRKIAFVYQRRPLLSPVFPGLEEAVSGMKRGGTRRFTAPPELGYGSEKVMLPDGTVVPGGTTLAVEVSLEEVSAMYV
jgi:FKBP-type peptidyl-prolyl cis-trans isomerase